tara:strand:- start:991 stop:1179 length:189 start_codon:yes stop_codon:yes gene_type:complete
MFTIIYWVGDDELYPYLNDNKTLKLFESLKEADKTANLLDETGTEHHEKVEARVISIEGVKE